MEKFKLSDVDLLGMIELGDVKGIEELVTPTSDNMYISRSSSFWTQYTLTEASELREQLKRILPLVSGKKAFVILDYMANLSGKVYYAQIQRHISRPDKANTEQAKICLIEDIGNIIRFIEGDSLKPSKNVLPTGEDLVAKRNIECNNHALLYLFSKSFKLPEGYNILNTGLGGIFIGPYLYNMYGRDWTNMTKSKYATETNPSEPQNFMDSIVHPEIFDNGKVLLLDDNVGTGETLKEIKLKLIENNYAVKTGAVQYNWINFYRIGIGEKLNTVRFDPTSIDYVTYFNYPGHKLLDHAINILCGQRNLNGDIDEKNLHDGRPYGDIYRDYKIIKNYPLEIPSIITLRDKGLRYSEKAGFPLAEEKENHLIYNPNLKKSSIDFMEKLDKNIFGTSEAPPKEKNSEE